MSNISPSLSSDGEFVPPHDSLQPSDPVGAWILRCLCRGAKLRLVGSVWTFDGLCPSRSIINDASVEWLLSRGFLIRSNLGLVGKSTQRGLEFIRSIDASMLEWAESMIRPCDVDRVLDLIVQLKTERPSMDDFWLTYLVAQSVIVSALGIDWVRSYIHSDSPPSDFFKNNRTDQDGFDTHVMRVVHLGEMIVNFQNCRGIEKVVEMLRVGDVEAAFAELEVAKVLAFYGRSFRFVDPIGKKGSDYDLEVEFDQHWACADTKCKLETTSESLSTLRDSLEQARRQLPADRPGVVFVKAPHTWSALDKGTSHTDIFKDVTRRFFATTQRVVSVVFYFSLAVPFGSAVGQVYLLSDHQNSVHRFDGSANWKISRDGTVCGPPAYWVDLVRMCATPGIA